MPEAYEGQRDSVDKGFLPDGRRHWIFSQSKLKQVDTCPERGRRVMLGLTSDHATDSTALGRAVHSAIEACLADVIAGMGPWDLNDMWAVAIEDFNAEMALPDSVWVKSKQPETVHAMIARCLTTWYNFVLPTLQPVAVEVNFGPLMIHQDDDRLIEVRGQIDYVDETGLADWKTAGRRWAPWEHQRWDVQPTLYTWAHATTFGTYPWTWHVLNVDGSYQKIETTRSEPDWLWLRDRLIVIAKQLEADLPAWHKNDTHALCSSTYCPAWDDCKGKYLGATWPVRKDNGTQ